LYDYGEDHVFVFFAARCSLDAQEHLRWSPRTARGAASSCVRASNGSP
jgi:hypothetical protein